jgi:hypothetical protein
LERVKGIEFPSGAKGRDMNLGRNLGPNVLAKGQKPWKCWSG